MSEGARIERAMERGVPSLGQLKDALVTTMKKRGYLLDLDGQMFRIRSEHSCLNELNQRAGAILMKRAEVYLHQKLVELGVDFQWLLHVHDEWQLAVRPADVPTVLQVATEAFSYATEYYKFRCPITGGGNEGRNWSETH
jgi:DNA polymerase-1